MTGREYIESIPKDTGHIPVLLSEVLALLALRPGMNVIDATLGGGGYTTRIVQAVTPGGRVLAIDRDKEAIERFRKRTRRDPMLARAVETGSLFIAHGNFSAMKEIAEQNGFPTVDAIVADLGFSSDQVDDATRGFSFEADGALDMRLDQSQSLTAAEVINRTPTEDLARVLRENGDEPYARDIARRIERERPFLTTTALRAAVVAALPAMERRRRGRHPEAQAFQAIRMVVNDELPALHSLLSGALPILKEDGTIAIVSFHSGEDRIVKKFFAEQSRGCVCPKAFPVCVCGRKQSLSIVTKKPIVPGKSEQSTNPRSRSAKLRVAKKNKK
jgi:16S rRNA (cytosine1402-N4)-methyltransferase